MPMPPEIENTLTHPSAVPLQTPRNPETIDWEPLREKIDDGEKFRFPYTV